MCVCTKLTGQRDREIEREKERESRRRTERVAINLHLASRDALFGLVAAPMRLSAVPVTCWAGVGMPLLIAASPPPPRKKLAVHLTHCGQLILGKISKFDAISCQILRLICTKFNFRWDSAPDPAGGAYNTPSDSLDVFKGPTSKGRDGEEGEGKTQGGRKGKRRRGGREGRGGEGRAGEGRV